MFFNDVMPGEMFRESAARYNALNALLNAGKTPVSETYSAAPVCRTVQVCNTGSAAVSAYMPLEFTGESTYDFTRVPEVPGFYVRQASGARQPWGIAAADIAPGAWGEAVVSGVTLAHFAAVGAQAGEFALPVAGGLIPHGSCGALVLAPPRVDDSGVLRPGTVCLSGALTLPESHFQVTCTALEPLTFHVAAGSGGTMFPLLTVNDADVPVTTAAQEFYLFLVISYTRSDSGVPTYRSEYRTATEVADSDCFTFKLARCNRYGKVTPLLLPEILDMPGWCL